MSKTLIIFALIGITLVTLVEAKETCREKIIRKYPNAKCVNVDKSNFRNNCKAECKNLGEKECQGKRGQIQKLNCRHKENQDKVICCCK